MSKVIEFGQLKGITGVLAPQELRAVLAICSGLSGKQAARELGCAPSTMKKTVERLFFKLGVSNRAALVAEAFKRGLIGHALALLLAAHGALADDPMARVRRGSSEKKIEYRVAARRVEAALTA